MAASSRGKGIRRIAGATLCLMLAGGSNCAAQELKLAAASDLTFVLPEIATQFEKETGMHVALTFGSSGNFTTQIENGAPFDVFLSADSAYPKKLAAERLADGATLVRYATGRIVLWVPKESKLDLRRGLEVLLDPRVKRIAIANPRHAPYGRAAEAAMRHFGIYERVRDKLVLGENIAQTAQFIASGNAEIGIIALSLAPAMRESGRYAEIPTDSYPPIEQAGVALKSSRNGEAARKFLVFLKEPAIRELLRRGGFATP